MDLVAARLFAMDLRTGAIGVRLGSDELTESVGLLFRRVQHSLGQFPKALGRHRRQELFAILKVPIRRVVGNARASRYFPQSKASRPDLGDKLNCRL